MDKENEQLLRVLCWNSVGVCCAVVLELKDAQAIPSDLDIQAHVLEESRLVVEMLEFCNLHQISVQQESPS